MDRGLLERIGLLIRGVGDQVDVTSRRLTEGRFDVLVIDLQCPLVSFSLSLR